MAFESTKGSGNVWNPTQDAEGNPKFVGTEKDILDGYYIHKKEGVGQNNSNVYTLETEEGVKNEVWGTKLLNDEFEKIRLGKYCRIQWHGKKQVKSCVNKPIEKCKSTEAFQNYEVFVDDAHPMHPNFAGGIAQQSAAPAANANQASKPAATPTTFKPVAQDDSLPF